MAKKQIICDTDVMIDYWDASQKRHFLTKEILDNQIGIDNIVLSAVTKMELISGASNKNDLNKISKSLNRFKISLIGNEVTVEAFKLLEKYKLSHGLNIPDCFIAATAIITELELFTYNTKDYKFISHLKLFKP